MEKSKKTVFLDIDGVVCLYPERQQDWCGNQNDRLSGHCCKNLKSVLDAAEAKIVITSSWRLDENDLLNLYRQLDRFGITKEYIAGETPDLRSDKSIKTHNQLRWREISRYIDDYGVESYVIIDDFNLDRFDKPHLVKTKRHEGLTAKLAEVCINKLKKI